MIQDIQDFFNSLSIEQQEQLKQLLRLPDQDLPQKKARALLKSAPGGFEAAWRHLYLQEHIAQYSYPLGEKGSTFVQQLTRIELGEKFPQFPYLMTSITL